MQDANAVLFQMQRRCRAAGQNDAALRLAECAQRIPHAGAVLSLLGYLHGTSQKPTADPSREAPSRDPPPATRQMSEVESLDLKSLEGRIPYYRTKSSLSSRLISQFRSCSLLANLFISAAELEVEVLSPTPS